MMRTPVQSSNVESIGYSPMMRILEVCFKKDRIYHYTDVPPDVYAALMASPSKGGFMNSIAYAYSYAKGEAPEEPGGAIDSMWDAWEALAAFAAENPEIALAPELLVQNGRQPAAPGQQPSQYAGQPVQPATPGQRLRRIDESPGVPATSLPIPDDWKGGI
jgi:hypothetical protein